jgi:hypothetical protein
MSHRTAAWLAWSLCAVCAALIAIALFPLFLDFVTPESIHLPPEGSPSYGFAVLTGVLSLAYPTVGALIASRLPSNPIGWIFCSVGLLYAAQRFSLAYADYAVVENLALPGSDYAAWFSSLVEFTGLILAGVFVMLLFPSGRDSMRCGSYGGRLSGAMLETLRGICALPDSLGTAVLAVNSSSRSRIAANTQRSLF